MGPDKVQIGVYSKVLFKQVQVFRKMFTGGWQETESRTAHLPEGDPITFQRFVNFLYFGKIGVLNRKNQTDTDGPDWDYMRLYAFAHKYCFDSLMDYALSRLFFYYEKGGFYSWSPKLEAIIFVSQNISAGCTLQRYTNKLFVRDLYWDSAYSEDDLRRLLKESPESVLYLGIYIRDEFVDGNPPEYEDTEGWCANYHLHGKEVACPVPAPEDDYLNLRR